MGKRIIMLVCLALLGIAGGKAVLKERDLARTIGVLKAELQANYEKHQAFMARYEQQGAAQHLQLVKYMQQCEQIGLMLYSQSTENTFDMAYACQQATSLYHQLNQRDSKMWQYNRIITHIEQEIERYDALITSLKSIPPVKDASEVLTESDTILLQAIDSLAAARHRLPTDEIEKETPEDMPPPPAPTSEEEDSQEETEEPLYLSGQQLTDRDDCLEFAQTLRDGMQTFLETMQAESTYYQSVRTKVEALNEFAQSRYKVLQDNIFRNGGSNYFTILSTFPMQYLRAKNSVRSKYMPFEGHAQNFSEWRGIYVVSISIFLLFYLMLALVISYVFLRWLLPKRWRGNNYALKRRMLNNVVGIALFAIFVMVVRTFAQRNFVQMSTGLIINIAWLMEAIYLSLYIRLKGEQMRHASQIYMPLMCTAFLVILMRITLMPNILVNLIFPPIMLALTLWQLKSAGRHRIHLPMLDRIYTDITSAAMCIACLASWIGFTLLAVQIMIWWTFQLAAIMTITCIYDLMEMYENRVIVFRIRPELKERQQRGENIENERAQLLEEMRAGRHIGKTWLYDLVHRTLVPIMAVLSVLFSILWAAKVFEMTALCVKIFSMDIIRRPGLIRFSLYKLCLVAELWFIFRYLNYVIRSCYIHYRRQLMKPGTEMNLTLARNVTAILVWGLYIIIAMVMLEVPWSGISLVTAGLATGLGFAMQNLIENFFYGISLMTGRLHVGDYIECDGIRGKVESITYQSTQIVTTDGCVIAFLNSTLFSKNFKNMTRNHRYELVRLPVGVAYGTDVEQVRRLLVEALTPICLEKNAFGQNVTNVRKTPLSVSFIDFGESSVDLAVVVWMLVEEKIPLSGRLREAIYNTLNANGIEIPFPQRDVHMK
ncbi:MAG: mechanosensitive ion channel [Bacteroidaceae bacterium]|nr:mechanosensitive ion channel [Bacteroidaceae bacterium]